MPLYIRDDAVDALAEELRRLTAAPTKTEAVRAALVAGIACARVAATPLAERLGPLKARARALGPLDPAFDARRALADLWGER